MRSTLAVAPKAGDVVQVLARGDGEPPGGLRGVVQGVRPDGFVVVLLADGSRRPYRPEELATLRPGGAAGSGAPGGGPR